MASMRAGVDAYSTRSRGGSSQNSSRHDAGTVARPSCFGQRGDRPPLSRHQPCASGGPRDAWQSPLDSASLRNSASGAPRGTHRGRTHALAREPGASHHHPVSHGPDDRTGDRVIFIDGHRGIVRHRATERDAQWRLDIGSRRVPGRWRGLRDFDLRGCKQRRSTGSVRRLRRRRWQCPGRHRPGRLDPEDRRDRPRRGELPDVQFQVPVGGIPGLRRLELQ